MSATINATLTKQAVNCGDHGQDIVTAVEPREGETVREFCDRLLVEADWRGRTAVKGDYYITLRVVEPEPEPAPVDDAFATESRPF